MSQNQSWTRRKLLVTVTVSSAFGICLLHGSRRETVQQNFVKVVRAVELILGIPVPGAQLNAKISTANFTSAISSVTNSTGLSSIFNDEVKSALQDAVPILVGVGIELAIPAIFNFNLASAPLHNERTPLVTK